MQLMLYVGNDLIEAVPLEADKVPIPGYLGKIKRHLKEKYAGLLQNTQEKIDFLVIGSEKKE